MSAYEISEMMTPLTVCTLLVSGELETTVTAELSTNDQTATGKDYCTVLLIISFHTDFHISSK